MGQGDRVKRHALGSENTLRLQNLVQGAVHTGVIRGHRFNEVGWWRGKGRLAAGTRIRQAW
jgi:hypothetical protein